MYDAGFPCQPFAAQGSHLGTDCPVNGHISSEIIKYLSECRPRMFLLENVVGITQSTHKRSFARLINALRSIGGGPGQPHYQVLATILNSFHYWPPSFHYWHLGEIFKQTPSSVPMAAATVPKAFATDLFL